MTTPAGLANYKRSMITRFGGACTFCGDSTTAGVDFAFLNGSGKWGACCVKCSASRPAIVSGIAQRIGKVQDSLTAEQTASLVVPANLVDAIGGTLTDAEMTVVIAEMMTLAVTVESMTKPAAAPAGNEVLTGRVYTVNGVHYRIKESKTGNQYALRFINNGEGRKGSWEYDRGAIMTVRRSGTLMTAADAAALGHSTHHCVFCSLELTDERSTIVGYGPICAGKHGLPWG